MKQYEKYPIGIVLLSNALALSIYVLGIFIVYHLHWITALLFLIFILFLEIRIIKTHCINCYYWGKTCGFGKGRISSLFFKKGESAKFCANKMTWKDMIPDLLISLAPVTIGVVLLFIKFDLFIMLATVLLLFLSTTGNAIIRGKYTCKYCKQRELGCPADQLFNKNKQQNS